MKKNVLLLLASLATGFIVAEVICRINGSYLSYNERTGGGEYTSPFTPNTGGWALRYKPYEKRLMKRNEFTDSWTANEDGLKDRSISTVKNRKRILILGDSFTEGVGAPFDSSFPRILESILWLHKDSVQIINAGIGGSDVFFEYKLLQVLLLKYKPDAVIATTNPSDVVEYLTRGGFERFLPDSSVQYRSGPWFEPLYAHSLLVRIIVHDIFHYDFNFIKQKDYDSKVKEAEWGQCKAIDSLQALCTLNHISFAMVFHPFMNDIKQPGPYTMTIPINYCREKNIPYVDELHYLQAHGINNKNLESIYWPGDGHFKSTGYEFLALSVYQLLENQNWPGFANSSMQISALP